jgi:hypothetical protein
MTDVLKLTEVFGKYTLHLTNLPPAGPLIEMKWSPVVVMGPSDELSLPGGLVRIDRFDGRAPAGTRADSLWIPIRHVRDAGLLVEELTAVGAGLMVEAGDPPAEVEALQFWLLLAIEQGKDWLEAAA